MDRQQAKQARKKCYAEYVRGQCIHGRTGDGRCNKKGRGEAGVQTQTEGTLHITTLLPRLPTFRAY